MSERPGRASGKAPDERPEYAHLRELKEARQWELMRRHGAHGLGIGRKTVDGRETDELALLFYVEKKGAAPEVEAEPVPPTISYLPRDASEPVELPTDVVESPAARLEGAEQADDES